MDYFNVPRKVNRHVLKAIQNLSSDKGVKYSFIPISDIILEVKYQMRNLVPISNADQTIRKSLYNMTYFKLLDTTDYSNFRISRPLEPVEKEIDKSTAVESISKAKENQSKTSAVHVVQGPPPGGTGTVNSGFNIKQCFKPEQEDCRKRPDPIAREVGDVLSICSLSGDEQDRARKSLRATNKQFLRTGRQVMLPKIRLYSEESLLFQKEEYQDDDRLMLVCSSCKKTCNNYLSSNRKMEELESSIILADNREFSLKRRNCDYLSSNREMEELESSIILANNREFSLQRKNSDYLSSDVEMEERESSIISVDNRESSLKQKNSDYLPSNMEIEEQESSIILVDNRKSSLKRKNSEYSTISNDTAKKRKLSSTSDENESRKSSILSQDDNDKECKKNDSLKYLFYIS